MTDEPEASNPRHVIEVVSLAKQADESMRAIGMYFAEFSSLVALMRQMLTDQIAHDERSYQLTQLALGGLTAQQIADPFFAMCRALVDLGDDERKIERTLREQVNEEIKRRNRIAHGDWKISGWAVAPDVPTEPTATLVRVKASDAKHPFKYDALTAKTIAEYAQEVSELEYMVTAWGLRCTQDGPYSPSWGEHMQKITEALETAGSANSRRVRFREGVTPYLYTPREYGASDSASRSS